MALENAKTYYGSYKPSSLNFFYQLYSLFSKAS